MANLPHNPEKPKTTVFLDRTVRDAGQRAAKKAGLSFTKWIENRVLLALGMNPKYYEAV